ncbi:glycoside hydrolase family 172 protein [Chryseolinea sp. T2]|uniref:glycoside hydrolase family 172 protein n=1 Tax=Chryseolinea sp. T2 TaxID=3129255 RepID=UPI0030775FE0
MTLKKHSIGPVLTLFLLLVNTGILKAQEWFELPPDTETRWSSFENQKAEKGKGGSENKKAKGHPAEFMAPGETKELMNYNGAGTIRRIWITVSRRTQATLRAIRLEMYWDGASTPAVSAPLGDFFGVGLGRKTPFENALFSDPEGRSFTSYIPMPFRNGARVLLINESKSSIHLFYDIDFLQMREQKAGTLYFHTFWSRKAESKLGEDFEILPYVKGKGRYLGMNMGIITDASYKNSWWGEGEVKVYLDGDKELPTLNGTGTEDYIGTGWGQGKFAHSYQGCLVADTLTREWAFYRYHVPDPVYFKSDCKVTIQLIGGDMLDKVRTYKKNGAKLTPVTVGIENGLVKLLDNPVPLEEKSFPNGWVNFYRSDDVSATAYFYLDTPTSSLPPIAAVASRTAGLKD